MRGKRTEDSPLRWFRNSWVNPWEAEVAVGSAGVHTDHRKHPIPTTQEKTLHMDITRWSIPKSD